MRTEVRSKSANKRFLVVKPLNGKQKSSAGIIDRRLFTGDNSLYALMDTETTHWSLRYTQGTVPLPLTQKFTSFNKAYDFAQNYMNKRGLGIVEVIDAEE